MAGRRIEAVGVRGAQDEFLKPALDLHEVGLQLREGVPLAFEIGFPGRDGGFLLGDAGLGGPYGVAEGEDTLEAVGNVDSLRSRHPANVPFEAY